jgi:hypothetical protein
MVFQLSFFRLAMRDHLYVGADYEPHVFFDMRAESLSQLLRLRFLPESLEQICK